MAAVDKQIILSESDRPLKLKMNNFSDLENSSNEHAQGLYTT